MSLVGKLTVVLVESQRLPAFNSFLTSLEFRLSGFLSLSEASRSAVSGQSGTAPAPLDSSFSSPIANLLTDAPSVILLIESADASLLRLGAIPPFNTAMFFAFSASF